MKTTNLILGLLIGALTASVSVAQTISTVAGSGSAGFSGDGGAATAAALYGPHGVAVDAAGNVYIADSVNNCIRKVDVNTGKISTFAGIGGSSGGAYGGDGGPATLADLNNPFNICFDASGNLYIADRNNHAVRKVDSSGIITTIAGVGYPCNGFSTCGDGGPATSAFLRWPSGIAVDNAGNVFIGDLGSYSIRKVSTNGIITTIAGDPYHYTAGYSGDGGPAQSSRLGAPECLAVDQAGNLYIADNAYSIIRKITATSGQVTGASIITRIAGSYIPGFSGDGGPATSASLAHASGVALDLLGNIYISDEVNRRIRKINTSNIISTIGGTGISGYTGDGGPATLAQLADPWQLATDACGNLYIADNSAIVIRKISVSAPVSNPSITSATPVCSGSNISAIGHHSGSVPPSGYSWQLQSCTASGVITSAYNSGVLTYAGAPTTAAFVFPNTSNLPCNQNYLITFTLKADCPAPSTSTTTKQIFINCKPTPVITGNTTICYGSPTTLCANYPNNFQYTVEWTYQVGTAVIDVDAQCITVSPRTNTTYNVSVTDNATGCRATASVTVVVARNNPDFTYQVNYSGSGNNYFTVSATPVAPYSNGIAGFGDLWVVEQLDASGNPIPGTNTSTGTTPNPTCWWIYPTANTFRGFDGTKSSGKNNVTCPNPSPGKFLNGGTYRIWHGVWNNFCPWAQTSHTITVIGHRVIEKTSPNSGAKTPNYSYLKPSSKKK